MISSITNIITHTSALKGSAGKENHSERPDTLPHASLTSFTLQSTSVRVWGKLARGKIKVKQRFNSILKNYLNCEKCSFCLCNDCIPSCRYICDTWLHLELHAAIVAWIDKIKCIDKRLFPGSAPAPSGESGENQAELAEFQTSIQLSRRYWAKEHLQISEVQP